VREGRYWHPLLGEELPPQVFAVQQAWFDYAVPPPTLQRILGQRDITRVWELREYGPEYEIDLDEMEPEYTGAEGYWTSGDMDWLVYVSHESSVTLAGGWLIDAVKTVWPEWERRLYTGWDYEPPPSADR